MLSNALKWFFYLSIVIIFLVWTDIITLPFAKDPIYSVLLYIVIGFLYLGEKLEEIRRGY